ncbi:hypothetical protein AZSI13_12560 [Azospira sp. I13]|uniref:CNP1-like family protein n=1 Tax=Azospira sp. I13 TaxID=1765050 RepID=UPI000D48268F|nr:CNP1-like family protein [Azospira sp. I13]GBG01929.1 hypothetical protein AZSI13_12560 [Azospira sp. I13]
MISPLRACVLSVLLAGPVFAQMKPITDSPKESFSFEDDYDRKSWQEMEAQLPPPPQEANLVPFYVSATATSTFRIDTSTLSLGKDGVVRYVLVVETPGGARNVSFEGLRCETQERRLYAFGRPDGTWSKARSNQWQLIENKTVNRHHAALSRDYFCPGGVSIWKAEEGVAALKAGGHPDAIR